MRLACAKTVSSSLSRLISGGLPLLGHSPLPLPVGADPRMGFAGLSNSSRSNKFGPSRFASLILLRRDGRATSEPQSTGAAKPLQRDMAEVCSIQAGSIGLNGVVDARKVQPFEPINLRKRAGSLQTECPIKDSDGHLHDVGI